MKSLNEIFIKCVSSNLKKNLFIFPHAGASPASYISAIKKLNLDINVFVLNLPGRLFQTKENARLRFTEVLQEVTHFLQQYLDQENYFLGHSMGGLFVYELIKQYRNHPLVIHWKFGISALRPPDHRFKSFKISELSEKDFISHVENKHFIPEEIKNNPSYFLDFISTLKNDFKIIDSYSGTLTFVETNANVFIFGFEEDKVAPCEELIAWTTLFKNTQGPYHFPGGHYHIFEHFEDLVSCFLSMEKGS